MAAEIWGMLALIGLAVLLYGICDGLEVALRAAQKSRLLQWQEEGQRSAAMALLIRETQAQFVMTLNIGMTCRGMDGVDCVVVVTDGTGVSWETGRRPW